MRNPPPDPEERDGGGHPPRKTVWEIAAELGIVSGDAPKLFRSFAPGLEPRRPLLPTDGFEPPTGEFKPSQGWSPDAGDED